MKAISGPDFYRYRALFLQFHFGNHADQDLQTLARCNLNDREVDAWADLHRTLSMDAYAKLLEICEDLRRTNPNIFTK